LLAATLVVTGARRPGLALALVLACAATALIGGGCGGNQSDSPRAAAASVNRQAQRSTPIPNYAGGVSTGRASGLPEKRRRSKRAVTPAPTVAEPPSGGAGQPEAPRTGSHNAGFGRGSGHKPKPKATKPHSPPPATTAGDGPSTGPGVSGTVVYEAARNYCGQRDLLQYAPEAIRDDAEALASFAEGFAPSGQEGAAHDGCLEGLRSIGIQP
jgi:hypothetical protein